MHVLLFMLAVATAAASTPVRRIVAAPQPSLDARCAAGLAPEAAWDARMELARAGASISPGFGLVPGDALPMAGGLQRIRLRQERFGIPVFRGDQVIVRREDGRPFAFVLGEIADAGEPGPFRLDAAQAAIIASAAVDSDPARVPAAAFAEGRGGELDARIEDVAADWTRIRLPGLPEPARAQRVFLAQGPTSAWRVDVAESAAPEEWWTILVDASSGDVRERISITDHAVALGNVFPRGYLRGREIRDFVDADVLVDENSPAGWIDFDLTLGNNALAYDDRRGDGTTTPGLLAQGTGDPLTFDFPVTGVPLDDLGAAVTNAFWAVNSAHDWFRALGFDEPWGAMQTANFGRGGVGSDYLRVFVQYQATDLANFARNSNAASTSADGGFAAIYLGLWNRSGELRDGAFDTGLVVHEYAHGMVVRLVGNDPACDDGTQPAGLGEGWADYFGASFTDDPVVGAWVSGNGVSGIRTAAMDGNGYGYANLCNISSTNCSSTENGEIWASTLWDLRTTLRRALGPAEGTALADRLIVEGMKFTPCRPTYPDARDGILLADLAVTGGAQHCLVWSVMAGRGLGWSTQTTGPDDRYPVPAYDLPGECSSGASVAWDRPRYGDDADARVLLADASAGPASRTLRVTSSSGDAEDLVVPAEPGSTGIGRRAVVALRPGAAMPGDGLVQVAEGDVLVATCIDCPRAPTATAGVSRALAVSVNSHQLSSESCHDDDSEAALSDFNNELPSLLDAGELATVAVVLGNGERFPLEDVRVRVTCDNPNVQVLPQGEILVGRVRERLVFPRGFTVNLRAVVAPAPAVSFADTATLTFDVSARGLQGNTTLRMDLAGDYRDERGVFAFGGVETFEPSSPTAALWTHAPAAGQPADEWDLRACGNGGGRAMTYAGAACADYPDTPSAATLVSPPVFDFSNRVQAVHPVAFSWWNDVDLGYDPRSLYCDSEEVLLYVTDNPARPAYTNPIGDRNAATQGWLQWPGLGDTRNTAGWAAALPRNAVTTNSLAFMSKRDVRLYWVFFTDVYNPYNSGGCRLSDPDAVGGGYKLDDVSFTYDLARVVPAADTTCAQTCGVRTVFTISPPGGARCAGDTLTLSSEGSEAAGCTGSLEYRFTGPGFDSGYQAGTIVTAPARSGNWSCTARCASNTGCSQSVTIADPTLDDSTAGRVNAESLRVARIGGDVVLSWRSTRSPVAHAVFRGTGDRVDHPGRRATLTDLALGPPPDTLRRGSPDAVSFTDAGAAQDGAILHCYRVFSRMPCAGTALDR